tara:strand:- start:3 stop:1037 length:1035 start_codon:yes stop_codon:yes gene_type:complete
MKLFKICFLILVFVVSIIEIPLNFRLFESSKEQVMLLLDFNYFQSDLKTPIELVDDFIDDFPTLNATLIPIKIAKANYHIQEGNYDIARKLSLAGRKYNPFLYLTEFQLGRIYLLEKNYDSAYYYLKKASRGLPLNTTHATWHQKALGYTLRKNELDSLLDFHVSKNNDQEAMWQNHLLMTTYIKGIKKETYTEKDRYNAKKGVELFPKNSVIGQSNQLINFGENKIFLVNALDKMATEEFTNKEYNKAIDKWETCIELIDNDYAYYFNIALSYYGLKKYETSIQYLKDINKLTFNDETGKIDQLRGANYLALKDTLKACEYFNRSYQKDNKLSAKFLRQINCD